MVDVQFPYPSNISSFFDLIEYDDLVTQLSGRTATLGGIIAFIVFFVSFLSTRKFGTDTSFAFACFITFLTGIFLLMMGLLNMSVFMFIVLAMLGSFIYLQSQRRREEGSTI